MLTRTCGRRHLYDKSKMAAQPGKKPIASITKSMFLDFLVVLVHRIPFDQTLLARIFALRIVWMQNEQAVVN